MVENQASSHYSPPDSIPLKPMANLAIPGWLMIFLSLPNGAIHLMVLIVQILAGVGFEILAGSLAVLFCQVLLFLAGINLIRRVDYNGTRNLSLLALFPGTTPFFLGIPIGIWILFLLRKAGVKETFKS